MTDPVSGPSSDFFDRVYHEMPPWDIGAPQPDLIALLDDFLPTGPVLDVGCGTGTLRIALAERGLAVLGIDLAAAAITLARAKAASLAPNVGRLVVFRVADALHPGHFLGQFGAVVDSGFFHQLGPPDRAGFVGGLAAALAGGGRHYLLGFAIDSPTQNAPRKITESELRTRFAPDRGWRILAVRPARFLTRSVRGEVPAVAACIERVSSAGAFSTNRATRSAALHGLRQPGAQRDRKPLCVRIDDIVQR